MHPNTEAGRASDSNLALRHGSAGIYVMIMRPWEAQIRPRFNEG
jgi:hypothetical protein